MCATDFKIRGGSARRLRLEDAGFGLSVCLGFRLLIRNLDIYRLIEKCLISFSEGFLEGYLWTVKNEFSKKASHLLVIPFVILSIVVRLHQPPAFFESMSKVSKSSSNKSLCPEWWDATQSFLVPGLILTLILFGVGQQLLGSILLSLNVGFLGWVLYFRCGLLSQLTVKKGVSFNLRHMKEHLHHKLYQKQILKNLQTLVGQKKKGPRVVERGGVPLIVRAFILYSDIEDEDVGDCDITKLSLQVMFSLLSTCSKETSSQILQKWSVKHVAGYLDELNSNFVLDEEERNTLLVLVLKVVVQLCEFTDAKVRDGDLGWTVTLMRSILNCMRKRLGDKKSAKEIQQWGINVLFNLQHGSNVAKESFAALNGFGAVLDAVRQYREALPLNKLAAALMVEVQFENVKEGATELRFLPEVFAEGLQRGVMSALTDMKKEHSGCPDIANCDRLLKTEYGKPRKTEIDVDHVEFVEIN